MRQLAISNFSLIRRLIGFGAVLALTLLFGCEMETQAVGIVTDNDTGLPISNAHVVEIAVHKKTQEIVCEGYTDSTGTFDISSGLAGFGPQKTQLVVLIEKAGYRALSVRNEYQYIDAKLDLR